MISVVTPKGMIYSEGISKVVVVDTFLSGKDGVDTVETQPHIYYPKYVEFFIEPEAIPGMIEALNKLMEAHSATEPKGFEVR